MDGSILNDIKKQLGPSEDYTYFDDQIMLHINTFLNRLTQLGVGTRGFSISSADSKWSDFLGDTLPNLQGVKTYLYCRVKLVFDPPQSSFVAAELEKAWKELEWTLNVEVDPGMDLLEGEDE